MSGIVLAAGVDDKKLLTKARLESSMERAAGAVSGDHNLSADSKREER